MKICTRACKRMLAAGGLGLLILSGGGRVFGAEPMEVFRFGTAALNDRLTNQFLLPNNSAELMEVQSVTPSCDCIRIVHWLVYVEPGSTGTVEILYVPDKVGAVDYRIYAKTDSREHPDFEFAVQGVVTAAPPVRQDRDWSLYLDTGTANEVVKQAEGVVWVDVRSPASPEGIRIPGSIHIPLYAVKVKSFLKNSQVVLIDEGYGSHALEEECRKLREMGFANLSIWYGGLNAWLRRGGTTEGGPAAPVDRLPPIAWHDIAYSTDWLVVATHPAVTNQVADALCIPFDPGNLDSFVSAVNAAIEERPQVASVLMVTETENDHRAVAAAAGAINAFVFFPEGGWAAWDAHRQMLGAIHLNRTVVAQSIGSGGARVRPGGCGGCPK